MVQSVQMPIASINLLKDQQNPDHPVSDVAKVIEKWHPWIIGMQEADQYINALDRFAPTVGMELVYDRSKKNGDDSLANPILFDPKYLQFKKLLNKQMHGGSAGNYPSRWLTSCDWMLLADKTDIWYNNTHVNSKIDVAGGPNKGLPGRVGLSVAHFEELATQVEGDSSGYALSFCGGDFNVDEDADNKVDFSGFPNATFKRHNIQSIYDALKTPATFDTNGKRKIDVIAYSLADTRVTPLSVDRLDTSLLYTDHSAICGFFNIRLLLPWWTDVPAPLDAVLDRSLTVNPELSTDDALKALQPVVDWKLSKQ